MSNLNIKSQEYGSGELLVEAQGTLDVFSYQTFKAALQELVTQKNKKKLILQLTGVDYVASSGWAAMLSFAKGLQRQGGGVVLFGLQDNVRHVYDMMNIQAVLPAAFDLAGAGSLLQTLVP